MDEFLIQIEKHQHEFFRYILRNVWDSGVAKDVFSEAVLTAYENRHKFTPGSNFRAWMYRIITNKCYVSNRETLRSGVPLDDVAPSLAALDSEPGYSDILRDPESFLDQCGDEVYSAFRRLSTAERSCLLLRAVEQFSYQEIAGILEMPVGTVMTHLARGRAKLRKELLDYAASTGIISKGPRLLPRIEDRKQASKDGGT